MKSHTTGQTHHNPDVRSDRDDPYNNLPRVHSSHHDSIRRKSSRSPSTTNREVVGVDSRSSIRHPGTLYHSVSRATKKSHGRFLDKTRPTYNDRRSATQHSNPTQRDLLRMSDTELRQFIVESMIDLLTSCLKQGNWSSPTSVRDHRRRSSSTIKSPSRSTSPTDLSTMTSRDSCISPSSGPNPPSTGAHNSRRNRHLGVSVERRCDARTYAAERTSGMRLPSCHVDDTGPSYKPRISFSSVHSSSTPPGISVPCRRLPNSNTPSVERKHRSNHLDDDRASHIPSQHHLRNPVTRTFTPREEVPSIVKTKSLAKSNAHSSTQAPSSPKRFSFSKLSPFTSTRAVPQKTSFINGVTPKWTRFKCPDNVYSGRAIRNSVNSISGQRRPTFDV